MTDELTKKLLYRFAQEVVDHLPHNSEDYKIFIPYQIRVFSTRSLAIVDCEKEDVVNIFNSFTDSTKSNLNDL